MKARMAKAQFSLGVTQKDKGMSNAKSLYSSEIDKQAQNGGMPADGQGVK